MLRPRPGAGPAMPVVPREGTPVAHVAASAVADPLELLESIRPRMEGDEAGLVAEFQRVVFEFVYLQTHSDIRAAVRSGDFPSGLVHWRLYGKAESGGGRDMRYAPSRRVVREAFAEGTLPETRAMIEAVTDWAALLHSWGKGERYVPAERPVPPVAGFTRLAVEAVVTPGAEAYYAVTPEVVAFYLPQYHRVAENDAWWGEGFTEWTNVRKARPNYEGQYQPHEPFDQDYYDLADPTVKRRQIALAKDYGIRAFCYYLYWFDGRRVLERPLDQMVDDPSYQHEFCVCWANENWTRTWDGKDDDVLLGQVHSAESDRRFIADAMRYLRDPRYMRIDGRLVLLVYRVDLLADAPATAAIWREAVRRAGLGELHLCAVQFYGVTDPAPWGFDAAVEFPPHGWLGAENLAQPQPSLLNPEFRGHIYDYAKIVDQALSKPIPEYRWYRGAFPGWDNTARRQDTPHSFGGDPVQFQRWMSGLLQQAAIMAPPGHQVVFVNAWNEWGEGAHLEPDRRDGYANLIAVDTAMRQTQQEAVVLAALARLRQPGAYAGRDGDERRLLQRLRGQEQALRAMADRLRATGANPFL